jgi:hypothetical protein
MSHELLLVLSSTVILGFGSRWGPCLFFATLLRVFNCGLLFDYRGGSYYYWEELRVRVRVRVTLRLTVSQSVCLGVEPRLGFMTRYLF